MPQTIERRIVNAIIADLKDRRGLRHQWEQIDQDIQLEILEKWDAIVKRELEPEKS